MRLGLCCVRLKDMQRKFLLKINSGGFLLGSIAIELYLGR